MAVLDSILTTLRTEVGHRKVFCAAEFGERRCDGWRLFGRCIFLMWDMILVVDGGVS